MQPTVKPHLTVGASPAGKHWPAPRTLQLGQEKKANTMFGNILSTIGASFGSLFVSAIGSAQLASLGRKAGLAIAVALLSKYNITDPAHTLEVISAGAAGLWSIVSSAKAHMATSNQTADAQLQDAINTAVQAAIASALPSLLGQAQAPGAAPAQTA